MYSASQRGVGEYSDGMRLEVWMKLFRNYLEGQRRLLETGILCDTPKSSGPLIIHQLAEDLWILYSLISHRCVPFTILIYLYLI